MTADVPASGADCESGVDRLLSVCRSASRYCSPRRLIVHQRHRTSATTAAAAGRARRHRAARRPRRRRRTIRVPFPVLPAAGLFRRLEQGPAAVGG